MKTTIELRTLEDVKAAVVECAALELALDAAETACKKRVERIKALHHEETAEHAARRAELESAVLEYVKQNRELCMQGRKSFKVQGHEIRVKITSAAECDDEKAALATLAEEARHGANERQREAAAACLRQELSLNREFIHDHYKEHAAWFEALGLRIATAEKWSLKFNFTPEEKGRAA